MYFEMKIKTCFQLHIFLMYRVAYLRKKMRRNVFILNMSVLFSKTKELINPYMQS